MAGEFPPICGPIPDVGIDFRLTFDGDEFTGDFDGAMGAGTIFGIKEGGS